MLNKGPNVPPIVASGIICLVAGAAIGYGVHDSRSSSSGASTAVAGRSSGGGGGGAGGGMGGAGGAQQPTSASTLTRMVRGIDLLQKAQNKGLSPEQTQQVLPLLKTIQSADKLPEAECATQLAALEKTLTPDQKQALADLQPQRGGGGRPGGGGGAPGSGGSGMPGGGGGGRPAMGGMGGGGGMGGQQDPDRPFASERNKKALDDLIASLNAKK